MKKLPDCLEEVNEWLKKERQKDTENRNNFRELRK